jgi:uncharacterized repeat protein (TIGR03803 family)
MRVFLRLGLLLIFAAGCGRVVPLPLAQGPAAMRTPWASHVSPFFNFRPGGGTNPVPGLIGDSSDNLYGVTRTGGRLNLCVTSTSQGCGVVYQLVHVNGLQFTERILHAFSSFDGAFPDSPLAGGNGIFYGTTSGGGASGHGTVFAVIAKSRHVQTLYSFKGGTDGAFPIGRLYVDAGGDIYGTTALGGRGGCFEKSFGNTCGTVFVLRPSKAGARLSFKESVLHRFAPGADGWEPWAGVVAFNGVLFGTTVYGGTNGCRQGCGTVFSIDPSAAGKRTVFAFAGKAQGAYIRSPLYVDSSGNLYGETQNGGDDACRISKAEENGCGTIFKVTPSGKLTVLHVFKGGRDGAQAYTGLTEFKGHLFGTTVYGGNGGGTCSAAAPGCGVLFNLRPDGKAFGINMAFSAPGSAMNPVNPSIFMCAITNELNGTTSSGGKYGYGTIFRLSQ